MQESPTAFRTGQRVLVRDESWTVIGSERFDDATLVSLRGLAPDNSGQLATVMTPADVIQPMPARTAVRQRSRRTVLRAAVSALASAASWHQCWTAADARLEFREWQFEPARAAVSGAMRILLADEVGLGKTIQAALIIAELRARALAARVLVLTPASIRDQWAGELRGRFGMNPAVFDQPALTTMAATLPPDVNPWQTTPLVISSIDLVKRPEVRAALDSVALDVLVVDEAHHLTPGSDRAAVVAELANRTPWLVLATATPHGGDEEAFRLLQRLGDVGSETLQTFRRSRRLLPGGPARRSRLLFVRPTPAERALLDATSEYMRALTSGRTGPAVRLVASVIARRAASSAEAVHHTLTRRLALLTRTAEPEHQASLPWEEEDADAISDGVLASPGLADAGHEVEWLRRLAGLAHLAARRSSKIAVLRRLLRRTREQLLVFSEFRDVARLVAAALSNVCPVTALHGGLSSRERRDAVGAFTSGSVRVLVATDAAGEGLNLQARCRLVVNVELPWTPRRLEQRIGRVDRLGQRRCVHAIQLAHRDSYEGTVIARLERRRAHALSAAHSPDVGEGDAQGSSNRQEPSSGARDDLVGLRGAVYSSRARGPASRVQLVYLVTLVDGTGRLVQRSVEARQVERMASYRRHLSRSAVRGLSVHPAVQQTLAPKIAGLAVMAGEATAAAATAIDRRLCALIAHLEARNARVMWQASLFDRRAEQEAGARRSSITELQQHLRQQASAVQSIKRVTPLEPQLIAAWLE